MARPLLSRGQHYRPASSPGRQPCILVPMTEPTVRPVPRTRGLGAAVDRLLNEAGPTMPIRDGARVLGCHPNTLYEMEKRGDLAALGIRVLRGRPSSPS